jgi:hypothetical protein
MTNEQTFDQALLDHAISGLEAIYTDGQTKADIVDDLHYNLFNMDYFIIGTWRATQLLNTFENGVFDAIAIVVEYERDNFGQTTTDLTSAESVCNMLAYIKGEDMISDVDYQSLGEDETPAAEYIQLLIAALKENF